jgi:hypothetical protein
MARLASIIRYYHGGGNGGYLAVDDIDKQGKSCLYISVADQGITLRGDQTSV